MSSSGSDIFSVIMTVYLLVIVAAVMIGIVKYVFKSIALYRLAQRTGNANPWMAWHCLRDLIFREILQAVCLLKKRRLQSPGLWKVLIPLIGTAVIAGLYFLFIVVAGIGTALSYSTGMGAGSLTLIWVIVFLLIIAVVALQAIEAVLDVLVNFHIYHRLTSHNMAIIHSVLGIFIPMYEAICLFIMSKKPYNPEWSQIFHRRHQISVVIRFLRRCLYHRQHQKLRQNLYLRCQQKHRYSRSR